MAAPAVGAERRSESTDPVLVEVTRGEVVENRHRGAAAVFDAAGRRVAGWGDIERAVYPRSAIKPLQALPLVETGAADRFGLGEAEIALASASHGGEPEHLEALSAWLARLGLEADELACGRRPPLNREAAEALVRAGERPGPLHNNCSGKHLGMLTTARHLGAPTAGYHRPDHPVQRRVLRVLEEMSGLDLSRAPIGLDGCNIPTIAMPLSGLARAMARLAAPAALDPERAAACRRIAAAVAAEPFMVAGRGRFCTIVMAAAGPEVLVKTGAGGMFTAALPKLGYGVALKIEDGAGRASETAMAALLSHLGGGDERLSAVLARYLEVPLHNAAGVRIGAIRPAPGWPGRA